ncbi:hypothetical protein ACWDG1_50415 [Streptomyces sp. NPDC001177]
MKKPGTVVRGEVGHDPEVTSLDLKASTPKATLSDCIDLSRYQTYDTRAKKVILLPTSQPLRYLATAKAERWKGRGWSPPSPCRATGHAEVARAAFGGPIEASPTGPFSRMIGEDQAL